MYKFNQNNLKLSILIFLLLNCKGPFATRDIEPPIGNRTNREIPVEPAAVLRNLQNAISDKNVANYMYCLSPNPQNFSFIPDPFVKENNPSVFENWNLESEKNYMNQVQNYVPIDSVSRLTLEELPGEVSNEVFADSAFFKRQYQLILNHTYKGNVPRKASGQAYFWIFKEEGHWYIRKWIDIGTPDQPSWSAIKAGFGQ